MLSDRVKRIVSRIFPLVPLVGLAALAGGCTGRPLRHRGRTLRAAPEPGEGWIAAGGPDASGLSDADRETLAELWLAQASEEHASIAAFSKLSIALQAMGAPPELLRRTHRAALEEIAHATLCYSAAQAYAGRPLSPGAMPELLRAEEGPSLQRMAIESLEDGCLGEGISALEADYRLSRATDPVVRRTLAAIARDEAGHAALAWDVLEWCLRAGGDPERRAVLRAADRLPGRFERAGSRSEAVAAHGQAADPQAQAKVRAFRDAVRDRARSLAGATMALSAA